MKKIFLALVSIIFTTTAYGAVYKNGKVTSVKMFSSVVVIYVDSIDSQACGDGQKRVAIKNDDPIYTAVVSSALAAKATDAIVEIGYHEQCTNNAISWDFESFWIK